MKNTAATLIASSDPSAGESFDTIGGLMGKVHLVKKGLASQQFKEEFHKELDRITDGEKTIAYLFQKTQG